MSAALKLNQGSENLSQKPPLGENRPRPVLVWENQQLSADGHREKSKAKLSLVSGQTLYGYVEGNPLYWVDPYGLRGGIPWSLPFEWLWRQLKPVPVPPPYVRPPYLPPDWNEEIPYIPEDHIPAPYWDEEVEPESCPSTDPDDWDKIPHSRPPAYRPKGEKEPVFQGDRAGDRGHGGSRWKKWDKYRDWKKGKPRDGTYDENGVRLRD